MLSLRAIFKYVEISSLLKASNISKYSLKNTVLKYSEKKDAFPAIIGKTEIPGVNLALNKKKCITKKQKKMNKQRHVLFVNGENQFY